MKQTFTRLRLLALFMVCGYALSAQTNGWSDISESGISVSSDSRKIVPNKFRTLSLDSAAVLSMLDNAPMEFTTAARTNPVILSIPMPDGGFSRFKIVKTRMMEDGLQAKFPYFRTFGGQGIDDPAATIKIDWTDFGFRAQILSAFTGPIYIEPYSFGSKLFYTSFYKKDLTPKGPIVEEMTEEMSSGIKYAPRTNATCVGGTLRTYRTAIACTGEYARAVGGTGVTAAQALSAILTSCNRVSGVYETEVSIRLTLIANNNLIVFTDPATDPFNGNNNAGTLISESQTQITNRIGSANFDLGHTFSTGGGGLAGLGVICSSTSKARGITGSPNPVGDPYDIDYVAHEVGHQFGGEHTFNATTGSCSGNGSSSANSEPGSGVTIMAYAGICGTQDLQANSIPYFNPISYNQIVAYSQVGNGNSCPVKTTTGNNPPSVNAGTDYVIPKSTYFELSGSATDPDGDALTYSWEQMDVGAPFGTWNAPSGNAPIFRTFSPVAAPIRTLPKWSNIVNNSVTIGEILPSYARTMKFRLTARDNKPGGGGVCSDETTITVNGTAGPFTVTSPNTVGVSWEVGTFQTVTWDISGTNAAPINCTNVAIDLSLDGGYTYPITLLANTANDGSEQVFVPNNVTTQARIRVKAIGNIFFDISNFSFAITATQSTFFFNQTTTVTSCDNTNASATLESVAVAGFTSPVTLSAVGNPAGSSVVFSSNPINPGDQVTVTMQGAAIPSGIYNIEVTGQAGAITKTRTITFVIGAPASAATLVSPANLTNGLPVLPSFVWQAVPGADSYTLEISTASDFSTIDQSIPNITSTAYTLTTPLIDNTEYYWRVVPANICGNGIASAGLLIKTAAVICDQVTTTTSVTIPQSIATVSSSLVVSNGGTISDVDVVGLNIYHTYVSDITATLISPSNTRVTLFGGVCGTQASTSTNPFKFNFDDAATAALTCPLTTTPGLFFTPSQALATLNGQNSTGTWKLEVADNANGDGGSIQGWGMNICILNVTPFPVNWLSFTGRRTESNSVQLNWATASEINNAFYEIERSANGIEFASIGRMNSGSRPGTIQQYFYNDLRPFAGVNYYRLKQVDKDGKFTYSTVVRVVIDKKGAGYVVYPNPATDVATVRMLTDMKNVTLRLNNAVGQAVYQATTSAVRAGQEFRIPVKEFGKGVYNLTITSENGRSTEKIMIQ